MRDIDRLLRDSLKAEGDAYEPANPDAAETRFMQKRGRRRLLRTGGAGLLAAAAAVAVFALVQPEVVNDRNEEDLQPASLRVADRFPVAEEPLAIAGAPSGVWVASREGGVITRIDPAGKTEEVELRGANELAVGDAYAWVAGAQGRTVRIDVATLEVTGEYLSNPGGPIVDMAVGGHENGAAWTVDESGCLKDLTVGGRECVGPTEFAATDVATAPNETWLLDGQTGDLDQFHAGPGVNDGRGVVDGDAPLPTAPAGRYSDLLLTTGGNDALWVSGEGGALVRLDLVTGEKTVTQLDGDYADLAAGYYSVWALVGHEGSDRGELVAIDVATGEPTGEVYPLSGKPSDLYAGVDGVWVTLRDSNEVVRIVKPDTEPVPVETTEATPLPDEETEEEALAQPLGREDLVMVFSGVARRGGMTYAMYGDGHTKLISAPIEADLYPSFVNALYSEGPAVLVERRNLKTLASDLLYVDVPTGDVTELVPGSLPAVSATGTVAYWRMEKENPTLFITEIGTDFSREIPLEHGMPRAIEWDAGGRFVYVEVSAGHEDVRVVSYDSTGELGPIELDPGSNARYLAPSSRGHDSVHLVRIESDEDDTDGPIDYIKLVEVPGASSEPTATHRELIALGGLGIDENAFLPENLRLEATGTLDATVDDEGTITWGIGEERSWILGFRTEAWLIKESGEIVELGEMFNGGLAVSPELLER